MKKHTLLSGFSVAFALHFSSISCVRCMHTLSRPWNRILWTLHIHKQQNTKRQATSRWHTLYTYTFYIVFFLYAFDMDWCHYSHFTRCARCFVVECLMNNEIQINFILVSLRVCWACVCALCIYILLQKLYISFLFRVPIRSCTAHTLHGTHQRHNRRVSEFEEERTSSRNCFNRKAAERRNFRRIEREPRVDFFV